MKLGFPKSKLGWVFVGVYLCSLLFVLYQLKLCSPGNPIFCNISYPIPKIMNWIPMPLVLVLIFLMEMINVKMPGYLPSFIETSLVALLVIPLYYYLGKGIEILFQKLRGAKGKRKK